MTGGPLTLGTAGHIDHGKTELVKALTGTDTDRLPQERSRGISIELGYAQLTLPSGRAVSVIDVPGHERFVRTMVAGATGIDLFLMTVAADDGVMPQTREHASILRALGVQKGVVAITKTDLANPAQAISEARELLPDVPAVPVSTRTGTGLSELLAALDEATAELDSRSELPGPARLHVDRAFTITGAGTVVTGTLWSGTVSPGDRLAVLPADTAARVRAVQVHDAPTEKARAGQRVAVNLNLDLDQVHRGDVLASPGSGLEPTFVIDAWLELPPEAEHGDRVQVHHGTREAPGRLAWLGGRFWQLRLEQPLIAAAGDRVVVRRIAPPDTLGGGTVLDPGARKHGPGREALVRLERLARGEPADDAPTAPRPEAPPPSPEAPPPPPLTASALALEQRLKRARFEPPPDSELDPADLAALRAAGRAVRVAKTRHFHPDAVADATREAVALASREGGEFTLAQFRDALGTSRMFAQTLLTHLDSERVTIRRGDVRRLRANPSHSA